MMMKNTTKEKIYLCIVCLFGGIVRFLSCFFGWPYNLHPDEHVIVEKVVDMLSRHSWEADNYTWPGHFLDKINWFLFQIFSELRYHDTVVNVFEDHYIFFYVSARLVTCIFGVSMIVFAYLIMEKLCRGKGIIAAIVFAVFPLFVKHSAYVTTDIPITAMMMIIIYLSMLYMDKPDNKYFVWMCILIGCSMTSKYPGILFVIFPAYIVTRKAILDKKYLEIIEKLFLGFIIVFITVLLIAPNLITNFDSVYETVIVEAENDNASAIGDGLIGNMIYYLKNVFLNSGIISLPFFIIGILYCLKRKIKESQVLFIECIYFVFISSLGLQWERWGMPSYAVIMMFIVMGFVYVQELIKNKNKFVRCIYSFTIILIGINLITGCIRHVASCVVKENRVAALQYCNENGITTENSKYDGYTPFMLSQNNKIKVSVNEDGTINTGSEDIEYLILSSGAYQRYYDNPELYADILKRYIAINDQCELIKSWEEIDDSSYSCILNVYYNIVETMNVIEGKGSGMTIKIYKVK